MWGFLLWSTFVAAHADVGAMLLRATLAAAVELVVVIVHWRHLHRERTETRGTQPDPKTLLTEIGGHF